MTDPHDYVSAASAVLRENIAKTIWLAEYRRATGKERSITWHDVAEDDRLKYLFVADAIAGVIPAPAQPALPWPSREVVARDIRRAMLDNPTDDAFNKRAEKREEIANVYADIILERFAASQPSPAATVETKDLAIEVARNRIAELVNERDAALARCSAGIGHDWKLSDEAKQKIDEINRNIREAPANVVRLSAVALDYLDTLSGARKEAMESHASMLPQCSADSAESLRSIQEAPSLNREGREHPSYDNPRDPFASPDRLPEQSAGTAREALKIAQDYLIEEASSGSVWSSHGNAKALAAINAVLTSAEPQAVEVPFANMQFMGGDKSEYAVIRADDWQRFTAALAMSRPLSKCATCGGLGRIPHESGGYGINCPSCTVASHHHSGGPENG